MLVMKNPAGRRGFFMGKNLQKIKKIVDLCRGNTVYSSNEGGETEDTSGPSSYLQSCKEIRAWDLLYCRNLLGVRWLTIAGVSR
jgi:hypothetical protein